MTEPDRTSDLRLSDADRHAVAELLREAAGEGRLDLEELDERLEAAYSAKVQGDLVPLLVDLPQGELGLAKVAPPARPAAPAATGMAARHETSIAILGGQDRKGVWEVGPTHTAFTLMGGIEIDLREAVFGAPEVVITANAVMGGIDVIVNPHTRVVVDGIGIMGAFEQGRDRVSPELDETSPVVRVKGVALMGAVTVTRKGRPGGGKGLRKHWTH